MNTLKHPIALNLPRAVAPLLVYVRYVVKAMTDNAWFPDPSPPLVTVTADLDKLEEAEVTALSRVKGAVAARDLLKKTVEYDVIGLKAYVYGIAGQHPDKEATIVESAGMVLKRFTHSSKPELEARMGLIPQEVLLRAKAAGKPASYEWQLSADGGATWTAAGITTVANTHLEGLTVGATYVFRFRTTIKKTTSAWSQTISFVVH